MRQQQRFHESSNVVARVAQHAPELRFEFGRQVFAHEIAVQLGGDEVGGGRLRQQYVYDLFAIKTPGLAEHGFHAVVVLRRVDHKLQPVVIPTGERTRGFLDIGLCVIAHAHGEQLHDFTREVFIRRAFDIHACIQKRQHGRILGHCKHQVTEFAVGVQAHGFVLNQQLAVVVDFFFAVGEMAVPKQREFFLKGARCGEHAVGPPVTQSMRFQARGAQPVEITVGHLLDPAVALGLDFHAQRFAAGFGQIGGGGARTGEWLEAVIVRARVFKRFETVRNALVAHQSFDRLLRRHGGEPGHLLRRAAKACAFQQMTRFVCVPLAGRQGLQRVAVVSHCPRRQTEQTDAK